ncbi:FHA domain-containing protein [Cohnella ginsengisoli]|uniref:FHA domain-containing protein n=1 Tax=Cohnella ginsengisoli TaxID=425004 RepID=A0A9X4QM88_9BACL|nr:FHA domain-containing protein [Cohnella ginsengisoli]MDG0791659.1 FHA domain-containing protein [Cohnella ginsengisoli]
MPGGMSAARWRSWLVALSAIAAGIAWKTLYAGAPGTRGLALSLGATAACAGLCLLLWNGWTRKEGAESYREIEAGPDSSEPAPDRIASFPAWPEPKAEEKSRAPDVVTFARFESYSEESDSSRAASEPPFNDRPQTEWLPAKREATELLASPQAAASAVCYLEWESAERPCKIPLKTESLVIGRSRDAAQHVDESGGMSRAHLEMMREQGRWLAKDLGSRNGSWLNGSPMAPYEAYPLEAGDCLQMAGSIYRFHAPSEALRN